jgi:periplasmic protein TonB
MMIAAIALVFTMLAVGSSSAGENRQETLRTRAEAFEKAHPGVVRIGGKVNPPERIAGEEPKFPHELSHKYRVGDVMILESVIDEHGSLKDLVSLNGAQADLLPYVIKALNTWRYRPATFKGKAVPVFLTVTVNICVH